MKKCRYCQQPFEPEGFEVFCTADCASNGNSRGRDNSVSVAQPAPEARQVPVTLTEEEFQNAVIDLAKELGWKHYHTRNSKKSTAGFPDLVLWRDRVIFAELKKDDGASSAAQTSTAEQLRSAEAEMYVWRPRDWDELVKVLT